MGKLVKIETKWLEDMTFESLVGNHKIIIDSDNEVGGHDLGPRPKPLLLVALAGCTGMDVISILKKMKVEIKEFNIEVEADMAEEHPKLYQRMKVIYKFRGNNLPKEKIENAINLSKEKYCGVLALFKKAIPIEYEIKIN